MKALAEAPTEAPESFAALAAAVHPDWHDAIQRLANAVVGVSCQIDQIRECKDAGTTFVKRCQSLVDNLIDVLDAIGGDPDLEEDIREDVGDDEPSLGSHEIRPGGAVSYTYHPLWTPEGQFYNDGEAEPDQLEPSLGSLDHDDQSRWGDSARADLEQQCEDEGER